MGNTFCAQDMDSTFKLPGNFATAVLDGRRDDEIVFRKIFKQ